MWQPRRSLPEVGDDVLAAMIRFVTMARDVSSAGQPQPDIVDSRSL